MSFPFQARGRGWLALPVNRAVETVDGVNPPPTIVMAEVCLSQAVFLYILFVYWVFQFICVLINSLYVSAILYFIKTPARLLEVQQGP